MARMNICKDAPNVDLAFAQAAPFVGNHRQCSTCLSLLVPPAGSILPEFADE
jgi:hypothetical protein